MFLQYRFFVLLLIACTTLPVMTLQAGNTAPVSHHVEVVGVEEDSHSESGFIYRNRYFIGTLLTLGGTLLAITIACPEFATGTLIPVLKGGSDATSAAKNILEIMGKLN